MVTELLFLLLPVAAASGWMVGRRGASAAANPSGRLASDYFKGLNYLLNEQTDQAIEVFIRMLEVDSDTVEIHLALASLFRRRGEVDRAIRIHQNLIARPLLSQEHRDQALFELGKDYMRAGLLDRAESLFEELARVDDYSASALQKLVEIYQQEREWAKAIAAAQRLLNNGVPDADRLIANFYCEQAEMVQRQGDRAEALKLAKQALAVDQYCVRASILEGDLRRELGDAAAAAEAYQRVEKQDPRYLSEVVDRLVGCYRQMNQLTALHAYLEAMLRQQYGGITLVLALAELTRLRDGDRQAVEVLIESLKKRPSIRLLERAIDLTLVNTDGEAREELTILRDLMAHLVREKPVYRCDNCGFTSKGVYWQCPGCKRWNTIGPIQGVEGE